MNEIIPLKIWVFTWWGNIGRNEPKTIYRYDTVERPNSLSLSVGGSRLIISMGYGVEILDLLDLT